MTKFQQNFELFPGDDISLVITISDTAGAAVDITTATVLTWVIVHPSGTLTKTIGAGVVITDGPSGTTTVTLPAADTALFGKGIAKHQFIMTLDGITYTLLDGSVTIYESLV